MKRIIETPDAPAAMGAYSQATVAGGLLFTAGQLPLTPDGQLLDDESVEVQTRQCLENVLSIVDSEGLSMQHVLKTTVYLDDIDEFEAVDDAYAEYFADNPPARTAVEVGALPRGAAVEIEAIVDAE
jgi:reactive intermediate/imine deaminase